MVSHIEGIRLSVDSPLFGHDPLRCQAQNIEPPISDKAEIGRGCNCYTRVKERRVFHGIPIEALGPEFEHHLKLRAIWPLTEGRD